IAAAGDLRSSLTPGPPTQGPHGPRRPFSRLGGPPQQPFPSPVPRTTAGARRHPRCITPPTIPSLGKNPQPLPVALALSWMGHSPWNRQGTAHRRASPRSPAAAVARAAPTLLEPRLASRWITHSVLTIPDPKPRRFEPRSSRTASSGELAAAELCSGG